MVVIRLARRGAKNRPFHNIVVAESSHPRDGRFIERLGFFNPMVPEGPEQLRIDIGRVNYWKSKGAKASAAVEKLVRRAGAAPATA